MGPQATQQPEKRRIPRKHPRVRLLTQVESQTSGASSLGRTENISQGGLLVHTRETFDAVCAECGTSTTVPFKPTQGRPVYCRDCFRSKRPDAPN